MIKMWHGHIGLEALMTSHNLNSISDGSALTLFEATEDPGRCIFCSCEKGLNRDGSCAGSGPVHITVYHDGDDTFFDIETCLSVGGDAVCLQGWVRRGEGPINLQVCNHLKKLLVGPDNPALRAGIISLCGGVDEDGVDKYISANDLRQIFQKAYDKLKQGGV
jgi:hypothetical protein